jgi:hypothetical protein
LTKGKGETMNDAEIERLAAEYIAADWTPDRYYRDMNIIAFATALLERAYAEGREDEREEIANALPSSGPTYATSLLPESHVNNVAQLEDENWHAYTADQMHKHARKAVEADRVQRQAEAVQVVGDKLARQ